MYILAYTNVYTMVYTINIMKNKKFVHKLRKISKYTYSIIIPKEIVKKYNWREKQKLTVKDIGKGKMEIKDWKRK